MKTLLLLSMLTLMLIVQTVWAQAHVTIQGVATDSNGLPLTDGERRITFSLYESSNSETSLWSEKQVVAIKDGVFSTILGSVKSFNLTFDKSYWLGIKVGDDKEMLPRLQLNATGDDAAIRLSGQTTSKTNAVTLSVNSLDEAYDGGGSGAGRTITADAGAVNIAGPDGLTVEGAIGIGTTNPTQMLEIRKNALGVRMLVRNEGGGGGAGFEFIDDLSGADWKIKATQFGGFKIRDQANKIDVMGFDTIGRVGIGTLEPGAKLTVVGTIHSTTGGFLFPDSSIQTSATLQGPVGPAGPQGQKGEKGDTGDAGPQGAQGIQGAQGDVGPKGEKGAKGDTGDPGPQGAQGIQGVQGDVGPKGEKGDKGDTGDPGPQGAQGIQGIQGDVGPKGEKGDKGDTGDPGPQGAQGIQGVQGDVGPKGEKGDKGDTGDPGPQGAQGIQGVQGDVGPQGEKGDKGDTGDPGPQGIQGDPGIQGAKGDKGDTGDPGPQGAQGIQGVQGDVGPKGEKGDKGDTGDPGPQGIQGIQGVQGDPGPQGPEGLVWQNDWNSATTYEIDDAVLHNGSSYIATAQNTNSEPPGVNWSLLAAKGEVGEQGPQGIQGEPGTQGAKGDKGDTGDPGPQGAQGDVGPKGEKGDKGDTGDPGPQGIQGIQGAKGDKGDTGDAGPQGQQGIQGNPGPQGPPGPIGGSDGQVVYNDGSATAAGTEIYFDDINNRIGIGIMNPSEILEIVEVAPHTAIKVGRARFGSTNGNGSVTDISYNSVFNGTNFVPDDNSISASVFRMDNTGAFRFYTAPPGAPLTFSQRMHIANSGNIGIGTISPESMLDVRGDFGNYGEDSVALQLGRALGQDDTNIATINSRHGAVNQTMLDIRTEAFDPLNTLMEMGGIKVTKELPAGVGQYNSAIRFSTRSGDSGGILSEKMVIAPSGNVGIGTVAPSAKLEVVGLTELNGDVDINSNLDVDGGTLHVDGDNDNVGVGTINPAEKLDVAGTAQMTGFKMPTGASINYVLTSDAAGVGTWQSVASIADNDWAVAGSDMYSDVSGNVGIGTVSPSAKLDVVGATKLNGDVDINSSLTVDTNTLFVNGTNNRVGIGTLNPVAPLHVFGAARFQAGNGGLVISPYTDRVGLSFVGSSSGSNNFELHLSKTVFNFDVGIGTKSPDTKLDIYGGIHVGTLSSVTSADGRITLSGSSGEFDIQDRESSSWSATDRWVIYNSNDILRFHRPGSDRLVINASGNVGIGISSPAEKLDVAGTAQMTGFKMPTGASNNYVLTSDAAGVGTWQSAASVADNDWTVTGSDMYSGISGNVGIGTSTPDQKLQVDGNIRLPVSGGKIAFGSPGASPSDYLLLQDVSSPNPALQFQHDGASKFVIQGGTGNVGIGTASPYANSKLDVQGAIQGTGHIWSQNRLYAMGVGNTPFDTNSESIYIDHSGGTANINVIKTGTGSYRDLTFNLGNTEKVRITASGNIGIGVSAPSQKLDVAGTMQMTGFKMPTGASNNYVLTSDVSGVGTWQPTASVADNDWNVAGSDMFSAVTGNVGIGTTSPGELLDIRKDNNSGESILARLINGGIDGGTASTLAFKMFDRSAKIQAIRTGSNEGNDLAFLVDDLAAGDNPVERMRITEDGNLGIGTTNPGSSIGAVSPILDIAGAQGTLVLKDNVGSLQGEWNLSAQGKDLRITEGATPRMIVANGGYVGIGTVAPTAALDIEEQSGQVAGIRVDSRLNGSGPGLKILADTRLSSESVLEIDDESGNPNLVALASGNVGVGTVTPAQKLDVAGTAQMTGFKMPTGASNNYVLTSNASGVGTWQAATSIADGDWTIAGNDMYSGVSGNVGIGDISPTHTLEVAGKIGINDTTVLYLPNQANFSGSIFLGNGGGSLVHNSGFEGQRNTAVGIDALSAVTTGYRNTVSGYQALYSNTTGGGNTANGSEALYSNTAGSGNTANGLQALYSNTTGFNNTASGYAVLYFNTTGYYNTASGSFALHSNTTGFNNTAIGNEALFSNTTGNYNTAIGFDALFRNTTGKQNTSSGYKALFSNTTGNYNTASGFEALYSNTTGSINTASGQRALYSNTTGYNNIAIGYEALFSNTTGIRNTAIGNYALRSNTTGESNTANGFGALLYNTTGYYNTASGTEVLNSNTTGDYNTASGYHALYSNTTGNNNAANGYGALQSNTTGYSNTSSGHEALSYNTTGDYNIGIGYQSNYYNQAGSNNTIIGYQAGAGSEVHSKSGNVFLGYQAGYNETGDNKLYIENSDSSAPLIGGDFAKDELYFNGNVGIGTITPTAKLDVVGNTELNGDVDINSNLDVDGGTLHVDGTNNRVGIGTTTPLSKLSVGGNGNSSYAIYGETALSSGYGFYGYASGNSGRGVFGYASNVSGIGVSGFASIATGTTYGGYFESRSDQGRGVYGYASGFQGKAVVGHGNVAGTSYDFDAVGPGVNYGSTSSIRWKRNIVEIDKPLEKLAQLRGVYFDWDEDHGGGHDVGMIAEEVGKVLPEIVVYEENGIDADGMDYSKLTPLLIEVAKAQQKIITQLQDEKTSTISELKQTKLTFQKVEARLAEMDKLKNKMAQLETVLHKLAMPSPKAIISLKHQDKQMEK